MKANALLSESRKLVQFPSKEYGSHSDREDPAVQEFKNMLLDALEEIQDGGTICADLSDVKFSASCIHETIGAVLEKVIQDRLLKKTQLPKYVVGIDADGNNAWDADAALEKASRDFGHKLVCVWKSEPEQVELLGEVDEQVQSTYDFVLDCESKGGATTRQLADHYGISIQAAGNRLSKTAELGIVRKCTGESVSGGGRQNVYRPIK